MAAGMRPEHTFQCTQMWQRKRTPGPLWSRPGPSPVVLAAVLGTQLLATLIAVYGVFITSIGWQLAGLVWAYSLVWFLVEDRTKLLVLRLLPGRVPVRR